MNVTDFFSSNKYVFLPTSKNPKVALAVDNAVLANNAFKLYNPFSKQAKVLKKISEFSFRSFNGISKVVWKTKQEKKSAFVSYLETKLGGPLVSSLYFSTIHDKVVIQLQNPTAEIIGYLKYPLNDVGLKHLENEKRAIDIFSEKGIVQEYLLHDEFDGKPFLILAALEGVIGLVERQYIDKLLLQLKREKTFTLADHPRIKELKKSLIFSGLSNFIPLLEKISQDSIISYALVYEHGDFTPWNIVKVNGTHVPFDFEHFVEDGLEYFDLIKYYYQIAKLLEHKQGKALITYIFEQINVKEINKLLQLFLIKEIVRNKNENTSYDFEMNLIGVL